MVERPPQAIKNIAVIRRTAEVAVGPIERFSRRGHVVATHDLGLIKTGVGQVANRVFFGVAIEVTNEQVVPISGTGWVRGNPTGQVGGGIQARGVVVALAITGVGVAGKVG